ncbi:DUF1778 domain-containing protein [Corynebacterium aquatimens]|uniref:type II toxin-antitoxin system TacA family antitoxin n=1 Tax=Corynebacterium TaxID=1716 RepID=UPI001F1BB769|nr:MULTISPECIES: DUF1778 domain-containing protein [Corynebacterium]QYH19199.1 DUF1778 domain-containing protein [Corynebacterium aquatimens]UIZ91913.1 DUF1778 domain-containing protein [Corynebacterium sp. CNCTC7651]
MTIKDQRLNLRATSAQNELLRRAAEATEQSVSEFVLSSAVHEAEIVLADKRRFVLDQADFDVFRHALDQPIRVGKLAALFAEPDVFGQEFSFDR